MDEAMKMDPSCFCLKVVIPANLESYIKDYLTNWCQAPITKADIDGLAALLEKLKKVNADHLVEMSYDIITQDHYNLRHDEEVKII